MPHDLPSTILATIKSNPGIRTHDLAALYPELSGYKLALIARDLIRSDFLIRIRGRYWPKEPRDKATA